MLLSSLQTELAVETLHHHNCRVVKGRTLMSLTSVTASWFLITSQRPSEAMMISSSFEDRCSSWVYGSGMTYFFSSRSPNALLTAKTPPTRQVPAQTTTPPSCSIRFLSSSLLGLWSTDSGYAIGDYDNQLRGQFFLVRMISEINPLPRRE